LLAFTQVRKIAVVGTFTAGVALALAPIAAADDPLMPTLDSEIASLNSLFTLDTTLANVPAGDITTAAGGFKIIEPADVTSLEASNTTFDDLLYGLNPANLTNDPGAYDVLNGALGQFDNAYNVGLFSLLDPAGAFPTEDIIGTHAAFLNDGAATAVGEFFSLGVSDLLGYFELPLFDLPLPS
jgi:hypothetical protein